MIGSHPLSTLLARHRALALALERDFPEADADTLADTLEGASDLPQLLISVLRSRAEDLGLAAALRQRLEAMRARLERLESRAEQKRRLVTTALEEAGIRKLLAPDFTAFLRPGPAKLVVTDESLIPAEFWIEQRPRLDRQQVLAALRAGRSIDGAVLANPEPTLTLRSL